MAQVGFASRSKITIFMCQGFEIELESMVRVVSLSWKNNDFGHVPAGMADFNPRLEVAAFAIGIVEPYPRDVKIFNLKGVRIALF